MAAGKDKNKGGRPTVMTDDTLGKLEMCFGLGMTDEDACCYAQINVDSLYAYQEKYPEFSERKKALKANPVLKAYQTIINDLGDPKTAAWYLERKRKNEFSAKTEVQNTYINEKPFEVKIIK